MDSSKLTDALGPGFPIPVEITPFCHEHTMRTVAALPSCEGCKPVLRMGSSSSNVNDGDNIAVTDNGNYIVDLHFESGIKDARKMAADIKNVCGLKIFMGSSTGNMLVDDKSVLTQIFSNFPSLIATHCEEESLIKRNKAALEAIKPNLEPADHPIIRDEEVCFESSFKAIQLAKKFDARLHILHISTAKELQLFSNLKPLAEKRITAEVCVHHLHFTADDYAAKGNLIKCNPAIKSAENRTALWEGLLNDQLDVIATDHAPHTWEEKQEAYAHAHAGLPLVQHSVLLMLKYVQEGKLSMEKMVEKMSHAVATCFQIKERGFIREGYHADLVLVKALPYTVTKDNILYKCGWSPFEGTEFPYSIQSTFVNGHLVYHQGQFNEAQKGSRMQFTRS